MIGKLSWVYPLTNANEIWFQHRKYLGPVQVEVHFAKIAFWGVQGPKTPKFSPFFVNWSLGSCPEFIAQPMPMKFGFSIENTSGECKLRSILRKSRFWGPGVQKTPKFLPFLMNWKSASSPEFISQPMQMRFGFSVKNTSGQCKLQVHFAKIASWGSPKTPKFSSFSVNCRSASCTELSLNQCRWNLVSA